MHDLEGSSRRQANLRQPNCRVQLLVHPPLQMYLVARIVLLSTSVAVVTALMYLGVDWYVAGRVPAALSFVPLLIAIVATTPPVVWFALVMSQCVVAPFVRLAGWTRQAAHGGGPVENEPLRLRAGDPSAELVMAIQQAIIELNTAATDERRGTRRGTRHKVDVPTAAAVAVAVSGATTNVVPPFVS